jgi:hypothetical protein
VVEDWGTMAKREIIARSAGLGQIETSSWAIPESTSTLVKLEEETAYA